MRGKARILAGIIILAVGVILLLDVVSLIDAGDIIYTYWPVTIIIFGLFTIIDSKSSTFFGVILLMVGLYLQLSALDLAILSEINLSKLIWPIIVVIIGIKIILPNKK